MMESMCPLALPLARAASLRTSAPRPTPPSCALGAPAPAGSPGKTATFGRCAPLARLSV